MGLINQCLVQINWVLGPNQIGLIKRLGYVNIEVRAGLINMDQMGLINQCLVQINWGFGFGT